MNLFLFLNTTKVPNEPSAIIGFIANILGVILNVIYNFISNFTSAHVLGISIILFTIFTRFIMVPFAISSQKSMMKTQKIQPEIDKINKKYGDSKDSAVLQKKNAELQALYSKEKINPIASCLPLFLQLPIFFALSYIMQQPFLYISQLKELYVDKLAATVLSISGSLEMLKPIIEPKLMKPLNIGADAPDQLARVLAKFSESEWAAFFAKVPAEFSAQIEQIKGFLLEVAASDLFLGLKLTDTPGFRLSPAIIIPILAAVTSFLTSYIMMKQQKNTPSDPTVASTQKTMTYVTPLMMAFFTISTPIGVGLYWITSNVFQICQQLVLNKVYAKKKGIDK